MAVSELNKSAIKEAKGVYFLSCNPGILTNKDLLIVILEPLMRDRPLSIAADEILQKGLPYLASLSEYELSVLFGLNEKQSFHLMAVFEMARRMGGVNPDEELIIRSSKDVRDAVSDLKFFDKEHFVCLFLNTKNRVLGRETISVGTMSSSLVHPREVFKAAIRRGSASVIFAHNHPSGDPTPSREDIEVTNRLSEAGSLLGIDVLDHVVIGGDKWVSIRERGLLSIPGGN
ncbi:RadC family protein [Paenibacillus ihuae]|uniref:RadC family protein n=1 Tax=Paenibacillus ihuae TaxID=1232431 RepID=UPI0006D583D0|nr:DNA repair protein RadC [Paenibacillus ihuae]